MRFSSHTIQGSRSRVRHAKPEPQPFASVALILVGLIALLSGCASSASTSIVSGTPTVTSEPSQTPIAKQTREEFLAQLQREANDPNFGGAYGQQKYQILYKGLIKDLPLGLSAFGDPSAHGDVIPSAYTRDGLINKINNSEFTEVFITGRIMGAYAVDSSDGSSHTHLYLDLGQGMFLNVDLGVDSTDIAFYASFGTALNYGIGTRYTVKMDNLSLYLNKAGNLGHVIGIFLFLPNRSAINAPDDIAYQSNIALAKALITRSLVATPSLTDASHLNIPATGAEPNAYAGSYFQKNARFKNIRTEFLYINELFTSGLPVGSQ